jgi:streptogramin lyase
MAVCILAAIPGLAQRMTLLKQVTLKQPVSISTDRYGHIFTGDQQGNVHKYDSTGKLLQVFSPPQTGRVSLIEAWPTMQVFLFYRDLQAYTYLSRFLTSNKQITHFNTSAIGFARLATVASDERIWVFDDTDFSLKKIDPFNQQVVVDVPLSLILPSAEYNINYIREYQNMLYVNDANAGVLVFDNFGNYKKKLPFSGLSYLGFRENELYYVNKSGIHFFDLYTLSQRSVALPVNIIADYVLIFSSQIALFSRNSLYIYQLKMD